MSNTTPFFGMYECALVRSEGHVTPHHPRGAIGADYSNHKPRGTKLDDGVALVPSRWPFTQEPIGVWKLDVVSSGYWEAPFKWGPLFLTVWFQRLKNGIDLQLELSCCAQLPGGRGGSQKPLHIMADEGLVSVAARPFYLQGSTAHVTFHIHRSRRLLDRRRRSWQVARSRLRRLWFCVVITWLCSRYQARTTCTETIID